MGRWYMASRDHNWGTKNSYAAAIFELVRAARAVKDRLIDNVTAVSFYTSHLFPNRHDTNGLTMVETENYEGCLTPEILTKTIDDRNWITRTQLCPDHLTHLPCPYRPWGGRARPSP
jgi:hypothetical protein